MSSHMGPTSRRDTKSTYYMMLHWGLLPQLTTEVLPKDLDTIQTSRKGVTHIPNGGTTTYNDNIHHNIFQSQKYINIIYPIMYTTWVSSHVPVNIKQGTIRVYTNFHDLNLACPKENFPMLFIGQIIYACVGHELFSFMDFFLVITKSISAKKISTQLLLLPPGLVLCIVSCRMSLKRLAPLFGK